MRSPGTAPRMLDEPQRGEPRIPNHLHAPDVHGLTVPLVLHGTLFSGSGKGRAPDALLAATSVGAVRGDRSEQSGDYALHHLTARCPRGVNRRSEIDSSITSGRSRSISPATDDVVGVDEQPSGIRRGEYRGLGRLEPRCSPGAHVGVDAVRGRDGGGRLRRPSRRGGDPRLNARCDSRQRTTASGLRARAAVACFRSVITSAPSASYSALDPSSTTGAESRSVCERIGRPSPSRANTTILRPENRTSTDPACTLLDG